MNVLCTFALLFLTLPLGIRAGEAPPINPLRAYGDWHSARIGGGGYLMDIIPTSDPSICYLHTDVGGFYRSDDGGEQWQMLHGALPADIVNQEPRTIVVHPDDPDRLLVCTGQHWSAHRGWIYRSDDGGKTFRKTLQAAFAGNGNERMWGPVLAIDPNQPDTVIAAAMQDGVFRSTDFGQTWQQVGLCGLNPTDVTFDAATPGRVLICARPYRFALLGNPATELDGGLFESTDSGQTWRAIEVPFAPFELVQAPEALDHLWLGIFPPSQIKASRDGGHSWEPYNTGLPQEEASPFDEDGVIYPETSVEESTFTSLAAGPDFLLLGSGAGTIYRRGAGDEQWQRIDPVATAPDYWYGNAGNKRGWVHFAKAISKLLVDPHRPERWWLCDWYMLWSSDNGGQNWRFAGEGVEVTVIHNVTQAPDDPGLVHMGMCDNGYFRSTDGGDTYRQIWDVVTNNIKDVAVSPVQQDRIYAIGPKIGGHWYSNHVFVSDERGASWHSAAMEGMPDADKRRINSIALYPKDADALLVAVAGYDGGETGGVYRSEDAAESWADFSAGLPEQPDLFRASIWHVGRELALDAEGNALAISYNHSKAFFRPAGADAWKAAELELSRPNAVAANPHRPGHFLIASLGDGVLETTDAGKTWSKLSFRGEAWHVAFDHNVPGRIAVGGGEGVQLSRDGGTHWVWLDESLPNRIGNPVAFAGDRLIAGTSGSGMFWLPLTDAAAEPVTSTTAEPVGNTGGSHDMDTGD